MVTVIPDAEHLLDHLGDPKRCPEIRVVAVRCWAAQQSAQQTGLLAGREPPRTPGGRADLEPRFALSFVSLHPPHHRTVAHPSRRATSFNDKPCCTSASARRRRDSSTRAEPGNRMSTSLWRPQAIALLTQQSIGTPRRRL